MIKCPLCPLEVSEFKILLGSHSKKHINPNLSSYEFKLLVIKNNNLPFKNCKRCNKPIVLQNKFKDYGYCNRDCYSPKIGASLEKTCIKCNISKTLNEFYSAPRYSLGVESRCIECCKKPKKTRIKKEKSPLRVLKERLRSLVWHQIKDGGYTKRSKTEKLIGIPFPEFKEQIERQFSVGMTWDNYGLNGWTLDHICPVDQAISLEELEKLQHYSNWRPLWHVDNLKKSNLSTVDAQKMCQILLNRDFNLHRLQKL